MHFFGNLGHNDLQILEGGRDLFDVLWILEGVFFEDPIYAILRLHDFPNSRPWKELIYRGAQFKQRFVGDSLLSFVRTDPQAL